MANRIIRESVCWSESINCLSSDEECAFYRLLTICDDFGRTDARLPILKSRLYPLRDVPYPEIIRQMTSLIRNNLIWMYEVGGKQFIQVTKWAQYQTVRNKKSKYPEPERGNRISGFNLVSDTIDNNCNQLNSIENNCVSNPIQSNPYPNPNPEVEERVCAREETDTTSTTAPLIDMDELPDQIRKNQIVDSWIAQYGIVDNLATRGHLLELIDQIGEEKTLSVIQRAAEANSRKMLSWNFIKAVADPSKPEAPATKQMEVYQRHSKEERRVSTRAAVVDLDGGDSS